MPSTRFTAGELTTSRIPPPLAVARLNVRTRALTPVESQNVVWLRSATNEAAP